MLDLRNNDILLRMKEQMVQEIKVEVKDIDTGIKEIRVEVNTNNKNLHSNINKDIAIDKINYNKTDESRINLREIKRGDVVWVKLFGSVGSEQGSDEYGRPCVCIQNNVGNTFAPTIIVACITSQQTKTKLPTHVEISSCEKYGLTKDSVVLLEQIRTLDKKLRIVRKSGHLDEIVMKKINKALAISIGEMEEKTPLEKLPQGLRIKIEEMLEDVHIYEKAISKSKNESLISHLIGEREAFLLSLQKFCESNKLNYKDYYTMYRPKKGIVAM